MRKKALAIRETVYLRSNSPAGARYSDFLFIFYAYDWSFRRTISVTAKLKEARTRYSSSDEHEGFVPAM